jgi:hypothetical protein
MKKIRDKIKSHITFILLKMSSNFSESLNYSFNHLLLYINYNLKSKPITAVMKVCEPPV